MRNVAFIQLARFGDLANILPICRRRHLAGDRVSVVVHEDFAPLLEAVSYVEPVIWRGGHTDVPGAMAAVKGLDEVIATQVQGNPVRLTKPGGSFLIEPWIRAGCEDQFHDLPLVFDRRDCAGEAAAREMLIPAGELPVLAYALEGHSSRFPGRVEFAKWLKRELGGQYRIVDLCAARLPKVHHLLGPMSAADVLICSDSLPLHLSYAVGKPTIALHPDKSGWYHSEPRAHWIASMTYDRAVSPAGRAELLSLLERPRPRVPALSPGARITHVVDWWEPGDAAHRARLHNARESWRRAAIADGAWDTIHPLTNRSSLSIGDTRRLPFIRDLIDAALQKAGDEGIIALNNSDSILTEDAGAVLRAKLSHAECCYSHRVDVTGERFAHSRELAGRTAYAGIDLFAFRASWWKKFNGEYPDLLYGAEAWDGVLRFIFQRHNPDAAIAPPVVYHERHAAFWSASANVMDNNGQRWNRAKATIWALENGMQNALGTGHVLFK